MIYLPSIFMEPVANTRVEKKGRWTPAGTFVFFHHMAACIGLPFYFYFAPPRLSMVVAAVIVFTVTGLGVTLGYHRLYAHKSYELAKPVEAVILFLGTLAIQGSVLKWSHDHRLHHRFNDREGDPYNVKEGFWHAHIFWIFGNTRAIDQKVVPDLYNNKLVMFQHRYYAVLAVLCNTLVSLVIGWMLNDYVGAFALCWGARLLATYHMTWFINSLAHYWGEQSFSKELSARDNAIVALLTMGEGYHNYHHTFPADYRNGIHAYHFDPSKWIIWALSKLGLARQLRRFSDENITNRLLTLDADLLKRHVAELAYNPQQLKETLMRRALETKSALEAHIESLAQALTTKRAEMGRLIEEYRELRRAKAGKETLQALKMKLKTLRHSYAVEWKSWCELCSLILKRKKVAA